MRLIYVGRLDKEKGIDSIIGLIHDINTNKKDITIDIFGKGEYTDHIIQLSKQYPHIVHYHGRKDKKDITGIWSEMDFFIMPSRFLETFGLTACESLMVGVPVIGYKKGGLMPFVHPLLALDGDKIDTLIDTISRLINDNLQKESFREFVHTIQAEYTINNRKNHIQKLIRQDNILMISDFINYNGGGVETHIHDTKVILHNKRVSIYGHQAPTGPHAHIHKIGSMIMSIANIADSITIMTTIKKQNINTVWRHSISRVIGWLPVFCLSIYKTVQRRPLSHIMTHHELGLFHPFPSQVQNINDIPKARSLSSFVNASKSKSIGSTIAVIGKFVLIRLLHKQLQRTIQTHIVPSAWLQPIVQARYPDKEVIILPHFVYHNKHI